MSALRLVLVAAVALVLGLAPLFPQGPVKSSGDGGVSVHAATASSTLAGGNDNDADDDNNGDDGDNDGDDNGNGGDGDNDDNEGNDNGDNDDGDNDDGDDDDGDRDVAADFEADARDANENGDLPETGATAVLPGLLLLAAGLVLRPRG